MGKHCQEILFTTSKDHSVRGWLTLMASWLTTLFAGLFAGFTDLIKRRVSSYAINTKASAFIHSLINGCFLCVKLIPFNTIGEYLLFEIWTYFLITLNYRSFMCAWISRTLWNRSLTGFYLQRFTVLQHVSAVHAVICSSKQLHTCASLIHIQYISHIAGMSRQQSNTLSLSSCQVSFDR